MYIVNLFQLILNQFWVDWLAFNKNKVLKDRAARYY